MNIRTSHIEPGKRQLLEDLAFVFRNRWFSRISLIHLRNNFHRLRPGAYRGAGNSGCIFYLLTELLSDEQRISSREALTRHFTGSHGEKVREMPDYQPARYLVRAFDGDSCERYGGVTLDLETLWQTLEEAILDRMEEQTTSTAPAFPSHKRGRPGARQMPPPREANQGPRQPFDGRNSPSVESAEGTAWPGLILRMGSLFLENIQAVRHSR